MAEAPSRPGAAEKEFLEVPILSDMKTTAPAICLVTDAYWPAKGGVEAWVHAHSAHLGKKFRVSVVAHANSDALSGILSRTVLLKTFPPFRDDFGNQVSCLSPSLFGRIVMLPFIIWIFPLIKRLWPKQVFDFLYFFYKRAFFSRLSKAVANADIVHCFSTGHLAACASDACRKLEIRLIQSPPVHFNKWGDSPLLLSAYARADAILCLSRVFKEEFERRLFPSKPRVVVVPALTVEYPEIRRPEKAPPSPFVLFLGRREKHKGLGLLLSSLEQCRATTTLAVAGPGIRLSPVPRSCVDLGEVEEPEKQWLLRNCDIFCVPSEDESFGIVYAEAMHFAKPVVALDIAPINEIVINGETGILVPRGDRDALAHALETLLDNVQTGRTMGQNGLRLYEEKYKPAVVLDHILKAYETALKERSDP
jgi:glycosyltransferase involved in cell wall biosynthesis